MGTFLDFNRDSLVFFYGHFAPLLRGPIGMGTFACPEFAAMGIDIAPPLAYIFTPEVITQSPPSGTSAP